MTIALQTQTYYNNSGGLDTRSSPTKTPEDKATVSINMDYTTDGAIRTRYGSSQLNPTADRQIYLGRNQPQAMFPFIRSDGVEREISVWGGYVYVGLENPAGQPPVFSEPDSLDFDIEYIATVNDEYAILGNGIDQNLKYDGTTWSNLSIAAPPAAPTVATGGAGALTGTYSYVYAFANYDVGTGVIIQLSPLSDISADVSPAAQSVDVGIAVSADPQVNARVIYRINPSDGIYYQIAIIADNVAITYNDNNAEDGTIEADFDNANTPPTSIFEEFEGRLFYRDSADLTKLGFTVPYEPWNSAIAYRLILDGKIQSITRFYGLLIIGTDRSLWLFSGDPTVFGGFTLKRISSKIGVFNNRCIAGETFLYFLGTNRKFYKLSPTDLNQSEIRIDAPLSDDIYQEFNRISLAQQEKTAIEYFTTANVSKVYITYNIGAGDNKNILVYNETESIAKQSPVWEPWNHIHAQVIKQFNTDHQSRLVTMDDNGFFWKLEDSSIDGDGAEINGTVTSATDNSITQSDLAEVTSTATAGGAATLTDATQAWAIDEWQAEQIYIYAGLGAGQTRIIQSNTSNQITVTVAWVVVPNATSQYIIGGLRVGAHVGQLLSIISGAGKNQTRRVLSNTPVTIVVEEDWSENPDDTSEYTLGGYETFHFSNWKYVLENYDVLKQLWFIWLNANASGDYNITLILQADFDTSLLNQTELLVNLSALNSIWGEFNWGEGVWGSRSVFQERFRVLLRFRAIRIGFRNLKAGQPWQINGVSVSAQNKKLFY